MYCVYIIQSLKTEKYYIGVTPDLSKRIRHHNSGANRSTRGGKPWKVIHQENFFDTSSAWKRERQIKSYKGGLAFQKLVHCGEVA